MANNIYVEIMNALQERLGGEYSLKLEEIPKNNVVKIGLVVRKNDFPYAPTIYLDGVDYEKREFSHIIDEYEKIIVDAFDKIPFPLEGADLPIKKFKSLDYVKANIKPALFPLQGNESFLKDRVTRDFVGGLVVVYNVSLEDTGSIPVNKSHLSLWDISEEELFNWAMANAQFEVTSMNEFMAEVTREQMKAQGMPDELIEEAINSMFAVPDMVTMFVLTTKDKRYGAAAMLSTELLNEVSDKFGGNDLFIIPSSVHELIACRADEGSPEDFKEMIREVNSSHVKPEERLSDSLFYFDAKKKEVRLADEADNVPIDLANVAV